jgi:HK97 gp10 family phage protein
MAYVPNERSIKLEGFADLEQQLLQLAEIGRADLIARNTLVKASKRAMEPVYYRVEEKAPYDGDNTGPIHLRDTVRLDARIPNGRDRQSKYVEETDAAIAIVSVKKSAVSLAQEFGTSKLDAQPFLRPAIDHLADEVVRKLGNELGSFIFEYAKKLNRKKK